ncbi:hypothetical protein EVG20_g3220 [Dentipellis fragilis]|uniref:Uncharacterized protein n=1 Tax=Dentipellis fragilis TaxID=205917 RepID=A0A4Y9Z660_9AGAM|nr:hypothetical protein EVG20_g3220 [Dentipellis fragilis]
MQGLPVQNSHPTSQQTQAPSQVAQNPGAGIAGQVPFYINQPQPIGVQPPAICSNTQQAGGPYHPTVYSDARTHTRPFVARSTNALPSEQQQAHWGEAPPGQSSNRGGLNNSTFSHPTYPHSAHPASSTDNLHNHCTCPQCPYVRAGQIAQASSLPVKVVQYDAGNPHQQLTAMRFQSARPLTLTRWECVNEVGADGEVDVTLHFKL